MSKGYDHIPTYADDDKGTLHAVIETPRGTCNKYAYDPALGIMTLKLTLGEGLAWPYDYGFVPQTLGDDGDPLDVLVLNAAPLFSGCLQRVRLVGAILLKKNDEENDRLIACPERLPGTALPADAFDDIDGIPKAMLHGIERFLVEYSTEQGNEIAIGGTRSKAEAREIVKAGRARFKKRL